MEKKLNIGSVVFVAKETMVADALKIGQKYQVVGFKKNRLGGEFYVMMNTRKNAVTKINVYCQDVDREIDPKTFEEVKADARIYQMFMNSLLIVEGAE